VKAATTVELFVLNKEDLDLVLQKFPAFNKNLRNFASQRLRRGSHERVQGLRRALAAAVEIADEGGRNLETGEKVRIAKTGTQFGNTGIVADPMWHGRVKVMVNGKTKSYLHQELVRIEHPGVIQLLPGQGTALAGTGGFTMQSTQEAALDKTAARVTSQLTGDGAVPLLKACETATDLKPRPRKQLPGSTLIGEERAVAQQHNTSRSRTSHSCQTKCHLSQSTSSVINPSLVNMQCTHSSYSLRTPGSTLQARRIYPSTVDRRPVLRAQVHAGRLEGL
jgi:hypothetical protein